MRSGELMIERLEAGVLRLAGPLTLATQSLFQNAARREAAPTMILNRTHVPYVDSVGLGSLVGDYVSFQKAGRRVVLCGVNERVSKILVITRVEPLFLIFPSLWEAIEVLMNAAEA
jgi:anti-anti-sigma factor